MPLADFIKRPYPVGLGTTTEIIEKLIAGNEKAMAAWDLATKGKHGGAREGAGRKPAVEVQADAEREEIKSDNVTLDLPAGAPERKGGNSSQEGLRRLERAKSAGDEQAADLLRRVIDPNDPLTVNGACVAMGWRQPTRTVRDTAEGLSDAVVRKIGPRRTDGAGARRYIYRTVASGGHSTKNVASTPPSANSA